MPKKIQVKQETILKDYLQGLSGNVIAKKYNITLYRVYKTLTQDKNVLLLELFKINDKLNKKINYKNLTDKDILTFRLKIIELLFKYGGDNSNKDLLNIVIPKEVIPKVVINVEEASKKRQENEK